MAYWKSIAAIVLALFASGLECRTGQSLEDICVNLKREMNVNLSPEVRADAEKAYSFAKTYIEGLEEAEANTGDVLVQAWNRVLHQPDLCDESSLRYVSATGKCNPESEPMRALTEATQKYASKCLTSGYIRAKLESRLGASGCLSTKCYRDVEFIDDQFIAYYLLEYPDDRKMLFIEGNKATEAMANATLRHGKEDIGDFKDQGQVHSFLDKRLYKPCISYWKSLSELMGRIIDVSYYFGGFDKLLLSLDQDTKDAVFRYDLCKDLYIWRTEPKISEQVVSHMERLTGGDES